MTESSVVMKMNERSPQLTHRQEEVLTLLAVGMTASEIGEALGISARTARAHTDVLKQKLAVRRSREIPLAYRLRTGLDPIVVAGLLEFVRFAAGT